jgi:radical SAM protein with 4Fe4S-binding SPASM domain
MTVNNPLIAFGGFHPDYQELIRYFEENKVYTIQIESNLACEQGCLYCYASSDYDKEKEMDTEIVKRVLNNALEMGIKAVDWLGGDPLLRNDWYELMTYAMKLGLKNNIWTSGLPLAEMDVAKKVVEVSEGGFISVHLDTFDEELYENLHTGNPQKKISAIIKGVDNLLNLGKDPNFMFNCITFTKVLANEDIRQTMDFFFKEKGMRTCLTQMCRVGSALDHIEWMPSQKEIAESVQIRDSINYPGSKLSMGTMDTNKFYCGSTICMTIDGDVTPCSVIRKGFGNIHKESLKTILEKYENELLYSELRHKENLPQSCKSCKNSSICWGCRASAYYEKGDIFAKDPNCMIGNNGF